MQNLFYLFWNVSQAPKGFDARNDSSFKRLGTISYHRNSSINTTTPIWFGFIVCGVKPSKCTLNIVIFHVKTLCHSSSQNNSKFKFTFAIIFVFGAKHFSFLFWTFHPFCHENIPNVAVYMQRVVAFQVSVHLLVL